MKESDPALRQRLLKQLDNPIINLCIEEEEIEAGAVKFVENLVYSSASVDLLPMLKGKIYLELEWGDDDEEYDPCHTPEIRAWARELYLNLPFIPYLLYPFGPNGESQIAYLAALVVPLTSGPFEPPLFEPEPLVEWVQATCDAVLRLSAKIGDPGGMAWCSDFASLFGLEVPREFYDAVYGSMGLETPEAPETTAVLEFGCDEEEEG